MVDIRTRWGDFIAARSAKLPTACFIVSIVLFLGSLSENAQTFEDLYQFRFGPDGASPYSSLIRDTAGNLCGTTTAGGSIRVCPNGCGTVFKLDSAGHETILHSFGNGTDGANPYGALVRDSKGILYGTTFRGGIHGAGTIFKITPTGRETVLYNFSGGLDGGFPYAGLIRDKSGALYGTTYLGGACAAYYGCGTVFRLDSTGNETVLHSFAGGLNDGAFPYAGLVRDGQGNLYGTTFGGGQANCIPNGCGTVFKVDTSGNETVLYLFLDSNNPYGGLIRDGSGNLYGTTAFGGSAMGGTVFMLTPGGQKTTLYNFSYQTDGNVPQSGVIRDAAGNLYGTTYQGGAYGSGTVYKIDINNAETILYSFSGFQDGGSPVGGLILDGSGNLYGTTTIGGTDFNGTVFKLVP